MHLQRWITDPIFALTDVDLIVKFAQLEFQYGNEVRAKALFEKVLSSYPKRTDLWSVFIDLMMKHGSQKDVRWVAGLFEGLTTENTPPVTENFGTCPV